jgi:hypothetical protein
MDIQVTPQSIQGMVKRLRAAAPGLTNAKAYEAISKMLGQPNWDTLSGLLKAEQSLPDAFAEIAKRYHWREAPPRISEPFTFLWEAFATSEYDDGPGWYRLEVTQAVLDELHERQTLAIKNNCEVSCDFGSGEWGTDNPLNVRGDELHVSGDSFWVSGRPKHCNYTVETRMADISEFFALIEKGQQAATPAFAWADGVLFRDGGSAKEFAFNLLDEKVVVVNESCIDSMPVL